MPAPISMLDQLQLDERTGCWNWTGAKTGNGYGEKHYKGKQRRVHRLAAHFWLRFPLESDKHVLHKCDNTACFNPKHLFVGTAADNVHDCFKKKRHCWRNHSWGAVEQEAIKLRSLGLNYSQIARKVSFSQVWVSKMLRKNKL